MTFKVYWQKTRTRLREKYYVTDDIARDRLDKWTSVICAKQVNDIFQGRKKHLSLYMTMQYDSSIDIHLKFVTSTTTVRIYATFSEATTMFIKNPLVFHWRDNWLSRTYHGRLLTIVSKRRSSIHFLKYEKVSSMIVILWSPRKAKVEVFRTESLILSVEFEKYVNVLMIVDSDREDKRSNDNVWFIVTNDWQMLFSVSFFLGEKKLPHPDFIWCPTLWGALTDENGSIWRDK